MKFNLCFFAATFVVVSYGWGLGDALKAVDKATTTVNDANNAVKAVTQKPEQVTTGTATATDVTAGVKNEATTQAASVAPSAASTSAASTSTVYTSTLKWDAAGYAAKLAKVNAAMPAVMKKMPLRGEQDQWYNAAYQFTNIDRQYSFMKPEQRVARINPNMQGKVDKFLAWVEGGMQTASANCQHASTAPVQNTAVATPGTQYDANKKILLRTQCQKKLDAAKNAEEISQQSRNEIYQWLCIQINSVNDAASESQYKKDFEQKVVAAKDNLKVQKAAAQKAQEAQAKKDEENKKKREEYKKIDAVYCDCKLLIDKIYNSHDQSSQKADKQAELEKYFNNWWSDPFNPGPRDEKGEMITLDRANEYKATLAKLKEEKDAAKKAADEAWENARKIDTIKSECENAISKSKLCYDEQKKRQAAMNMHFAGSAEGRSRSGRGNPSVTAEQANEYKTNLEKELADIAALASSDDEVAIRKAIDGNVLEYQFMLQVSKRLVSITKDTALLLSYYDGDRKKLLSGEDRDAIAARLAGMPDALTDANVVVSLLKSSGVKDPVQREKLLSRLPDDARASYVLDALGGCSVHAWNEDKILPFDDAIVALKTAKGHFAVEIVSCVLAKFSEYERECKKSWSLRWDDGDRAKVKKITDRFPKFDDATIEELICADETCWSYVANAISAGVAYNVLVGGKAKSGDLETLLAKKLPEEKIDMKAYSGAKFAASKKALYDRMSPSMKESAAKATKAAYMDICIRAKSAGKNTFELYGFYLGMSFEDAKVVFAHHFPDMKIREEIDGKGKDADHVIYIDGQKSPFCFAKTSDKKIWLFNFGKKLLRKWYDFDTQTYMEWAVSYGNKTKADMRLKLVEDKTTVFEQDMSKSYTVWFHQEAYQYRNNKKDYLLTYFGEERDFTFEGGIGGDIIKSMAAKDFRYVRGDPGSLRVRVVKEE